MQTYLLKGGIVATYTKENEARAYKADVLVEGSVISQIGENLPAPPGAEVIDCTDKWITPGFIDTHRHTSMSAVDVACDSDLGRRIKGGGVQGS